MVPSKRGGGQAPALRAAGGFERGTNLLSFAERGGGQAPALRAAGGLGTGNRPPPYVVKSYRSFINSFIIKHDFNRLVLFVEGHLESALCLGERQMVRDNRRNIEAALCNHIHRQRKVV